MIVELETVNSTKKQKELAEKIKIIYLISLFGDMKYQDILDFFPEYDFRHVRLILNELVNTKQLYYDKPYYTTYALNQNSLGKQLRQKYLESSYFIRYLINSKEQNGKYMYNVTHIGRAPHFYPFQFYVILDNNTGKKTVYSIMHCKTNDIPVFEQILKFEDEGLDKQIEERNRKKALSNDPQYFPEDSSKIKNRIVIVDNPEDMDLIHFRHVKYIVCRQNNEYLFKEG